MKRKRLLQVLTLSACLCTTMAFAFACGKEEGTTSDTITLDLFDTYTLDSSKLTGEITWTSSDDSIVTVTNGVVTPMAEGSVSIKATNGSNTITYPVVVEDSGARPAISKIEAFEVYETATYNLAEKLVTTYKDTTILSGVSYTYASSMNRVSISEDGIVTGLAQGDEVINVAGTYRGYSLTRRACNVTVLPGNYVQAKSDTISISTESNDIDPKSATIEIEKVVVNAKEVEGAEVTASITSGEEYLTLEGLTVTAKAVGTAVIELSATVGENTVTGTVTVNVHDDKVSYNPLYLGKNERDTVFEKMTEGENSGAWKYMTTSGNYWNRAVIDSSNTNSIATNGYKALTYQIKVEGTGSLLIYVPSSLAAKNGTMEYHIYSGKVTSDMELLDVLDENGASIKGTDAAMEQGKWYTIICDLTTYEGDWAMVGFAVGGTDEAGDSDKGDQTAYFKDFYWRTSTNLLKDGGYDATHAGAYDDVDENVTSEKDDLMNAMTFAGATAKIEKVISGDYYSEDTATYKIMSKSGAYAGRFTFNYVHDADSKPGQFFTDGKHYISFEIYLKSGSGLSVCNWPAAADGDTSQRVEGDINSTSTPSTFYVFNKAKQKANLSTGAWYTVVVQVDYETTPAWTLQWFGLTGSKYTPATAYIRNVQFTADMPVEEVIPGESDRYLTEGAGMLEDVDRDNKIVRYTPDSQGNWYSNRLLFKEVSTITNAVPADTFFNSTNQYISVKVRAADGDVLLSFMNALDVWSNYSVDPSTKNANVRIVDESGNFVTTTTASTNQSGMVAITVTKNEWYTVVFYVAHEGKPKECAWVGFVISNIEWNALDLKDLTFSETDPLNGEYPAENLVSYYSVPDGAGSLSMGTDEGFTDAVKWTSTDIWSGRLVFSAVNDGSYVKAGYQYISFKLYAVDNTDVVAKLHLSDADGNLLVNHSEVFVYDSTNAKVSALETGKWYTVVIEWGGDTWCLLEMKNSGTCYLKDLSYTKDWPLSGIENPNAEGLTATTTEKIVPAVGDGTVYTVSKGNFAGTLKYVVENGNWYTGSFKFNDVGENKYITFKVYLVANTLMGINGKTSLVGHAGVTVYDESNNVVSSLSLNQWYTVVISLDDLGETLNYLTWDNDNGGNYMVAYFKDITYSTSLE